MGRDMTPREMHRIDRIYPELKFARLTTEKGQQETLYDFSDPLGKAYPNLFFLFGKENMEAVPAKTLSCFESWLKKIITADDTGHNPDIGTDHNLTALYQWYMGKLDPKFHYRDRNDSALTDIMLEYDRKSPHK